MSFRKCCKECPYKVPSRNGDTIKEHSEKNNKAHNCHMIKGNIWENVKDETICIGYKERNGIY